MKYAPVAILGSLLAVCVAPCLGQQPQTCKTYFKVIESDPHLPGGSMERLSDPQRKWLRDKAPKKYPGVCYDPVKATYAIVWNEERHSTTVSSPETAPIKDTDGNRVGSTTTYSTETQTRYVTYVSVMKIAADGKLQEPPLFFDNDHAHFFHSSSASGLEQGIKFLSSVGK